MSLVLAVDGGNTKTVAAVADSTGRILGLGSGGSGDIYGTGGESGARLVVLDAIDQALSHAGVAAQQLDFACLDLAGIDWPEDEQFWLGVLNQRYPALRYRVRNDGFSLLRLGATDGQGVSVVLGTAGAVAAVGPRDEFALSFWLHHPLGAIGLMNEALRAASLAELGLRPATRLQTVIPQVMGLDSVGEVLRATTGRHSEWNFVRFAGLSEQVLDVAGDDAVLAGVVADMGAAVAGYVAHLMARCGLDGGGLDGGGLGAGELAVSAPVPVVVGGGFVRRQPQVEAAVRSAIADLSVPTAVVLEPRPAVLGTVAEALAQAGTEPDAALLESWADGLPDGLS